MMDVPHDITLTVDAIEQHQRERKRIDDSIDAFCRQYNNDLGKPISAESYFVEWELHAGNIHVTYEYSDQCGGGMEYASFPAAAISDPTARAVALADDKAKIEEKEQRKREQALATARAEAKRAAVRVAELEAANA